MERKEVEQPVSGLDAFGNEDNASVLSQAAFLLLLAEQMIVKYPNQAEIDDVHKEEAIDSLRVPTLNPSGRQVERQEVLEELRQSSPLGYKQDLRVRPSIVRRLIEMMAQRVDMEQSYMAAAALLEACLDHPDPLVRVSSAISLCGIYAESSPFLRLILGSTNSEDDLTRDMAFTGLENIASDHILKDANTEFGPDRRSDSKSTKKCTTSLLVHGSFPRVLNPSWWQPGGNFHCFIKKNVCNDLYRGNSYYKWSGIYTHAARKLAAQELLEWSKPTEQLNHVFAHSHGGSVAMCASQEGLNIEKLVLMSCPFSGHYSPNFAKVGEVASVRVKLDLIVLVDTLWKGGSAKPQCDKIRDIVLPIWFDHSQTHDPDTWKKHSIAHKI
ncbi:MAG: hypothetical protein OXG24_03550 [Gammaproteobacteria bacterium]|nr:hypothetical protein [Gammaproteobacteria bacterium]